MRARSWSARRILGSTVGAIVVLLLLAQLFLPGIAARRIRSRVARFGTVRSVSVSAWPAVELLWGSAGSVTVNAADLELSPAQTASTLAEAGGAGSVTLHAENVRIGLARVSSVMFAKRGRTLTAEATVTAQEVRAALPEGVEVQLLESAGGRVRVQVGGALFGIPASVQAVAEASEGKLIVHPVGLLLESLRLTLFSEPRVYVESVSASADAGDPGGYRLTVKARLQ